MIINSIATIYLNATAKKFVYTAGRTDGPTFGQISQLHDQILLHNLAKIMYAKMECF